MSAAAFFARGSSSQIEPFMAGNQLPGFPSQRSKPAREVMLSSTSNEAYTPPAILEATREALGGTITLDPASCAVANEEVRAKHYYTASSTRSWDGKTLLVKPLAGGLFLPWAGNVFLNPPGGFVNRETLLPAKRGMSSACAWWYTLLDEYRAGRVSRAIFYTFRLDILQNIQHLRYEPPHAFPFCIFEDRPRHWSTGTPREHRGKKGQPTHACGVFFLAQAHRPHWLKPRDNVYEAGQRAKREVGGYVGKNASCPYGVEGLDVDRFQKAFSPLGYVRI